MDERSKEKWSAVVLAGLVLSGLALYAVLHIQNSREAEGPISFPSGGSGLPPQSTGDTEQALITGSLGQWREASAGDRAKAASLMTVRLWDKTKMSSGELQACIDEIAAENGASRQTVSETATVCVSVHNGGVR